jgi:hypothetical protein
VRIKTSAKIPLGAYPCIVHSTSPKCNVPQLCKVKIINKQSKFLEPCIELSFAVLAFAEALIERVLKIKYMVRLF